MGRNGRETLRHVYIPSSLFIEREGEGDIGERGGGGDRKGKENN